MPDALDIVAMCVSGVALVLSFQGHLRARLAERSQLSSILTELRERVSALQEDVAWLKDGARKGGGK